MAETVRLTGGTLIVSNQITGSGVLAIAGGTLQDATVGLSNPIFATSGTLSRLTINSDLDVTGGAVYTASAAITVSNGLTLNGTATLSYDDAIYFNGTQTLGGTGSVLFSNNARFSGLIVNQNNTTLTIDAGITIRGGSADYSIFSGAVIGRSDHKGGATIGGAVNLLGKISADVANQSLHIRTTGAFTNQGTVEAKNGGTLNVQPDPYLISATEL